MLRMFITISLLILTACGGMVLVPGPPGPSGTPGEQGPPGANGKDGSPIVAKVVLADVSVCANGGSVINMGIDLNGDNKLQDNEITTSVKTCNGLDGAPGSTGANGLNGTNSSLVEPIKFCKNYNTSYPSTFPEYGLQIGTDLFAVYWDGHNSWMALIPPGYYRSTSTSAPCNFTVNSDGTITN